MYQVITVLIATIFGAFGSLYLKKGSEKLTLNVLEQLKNYTLILGIVLYGLASVLFIFALRFGELSVLYPIISLTYVWSCLLAIEFLGEKMNIFKWSGILLIILGVMFVTR